MIVVDASVVLANFLEEPGGDVFANLTEDYRISTINIGEIAARLSAKGVPDAMVRSAIDSLRLQAVPVSVEHAVQAGLWKVTTKRRGLSLADRICLALGLDLGATVYTMDRVWADLDLGVAIKVVR
jgi:ribonuclease VapC